MSDPQPEFCLSRAEAAHFEPMHGYRDWLKIRNLEPASPTDPSAIDV